MVSVGLGVGCALDHWRLASRGETDRLYAFRANKAVLEFLEGQGYHWHNLPDEVYREGSDRLSVRATNK